MKKKKFTTRDITQIAIMAAFVFAATNIKIDIPTPLGKTMVHMGNIICVLSGLLFGPVHGGLAAGIGSAIFDLTDPIFAPEFWITFIMKFAMGFMAGLISHMGKQSNVKNIVAAIIGAVSYVICYLTKNYIQEAILMKQPMETVKAILLTKAATSFTNAMIAMVVSVILFNLLQPALKRAHLLQDK